MNFGNKTNRACHQTAILSPPRPHPTLPLNFRRKRQKLRLSLLQSLLSIRIVKNLALSLLPNIRMIRTVMSRPASRSFRSSRLDTRLTMPPKLARMLNISCCFVADELCRLLVLK